MLRVVLGVLFLFVGNHGSASAQQWVEHRPQGAGYRIEFPTAPTVNITAVDTEPDSAKMTIARYEGSGNVELLSIHDDYPTTTKVANPQAAFDSARNSALEAVKGKLREEKDLSIDGLPARRIVVDVPEVKLTVVALIVLKGRRAYQAIAGVPPGQGTSATAHRSLNSLA